MADRHMRRGQMLQYRLSKHLVDKTNILMIQKGAVAQNGDPCALLSAVLQSNQRVIGNTGGLI